MLTIATLIQGLKSALPKVSYLTGLDIYLWVSFLFVAMTIAEFVITHYCVTMTNQNEELYAIRGFAKSSFLGRLPMLNTAGLKLNINRQRELDSVFCPLYFSAFLLFNVIYWSALTYVSGHE